MKHHRASGCFGHDLFGKPLRTFPDHAALWITSGVTGA
jgi:hypothetical protein